VTHNTIEKHTSDYNNKNPTVRRYWHRRPCLPVLHVVNGMNTHSGALRTGSTKFAAKICYIFGIDSKKFKGVMDQRLQYIESIALSNFHDVSLLL